MFRHVAILIGSAAVLSCTGTTAVCDCLAAAGVKLVNARTGQSPVDLFVGGTSIVSGIAAGASSATAYAPPGEQQIVIRSGASVVAQLTAVLESGKLTALVLTENGASAFDVPLDTGNTVRADRANVRIVSAGSAGSSELLDVWFNDASQPTLSLDPSVYGFGPYQYFDPGNVRVRFTPYGGTTVVTEVTVNAALAKGYAVVLKRDNAGVYSATVVADP